MPAKPTVPEGGERAWPGFEGTPEGRMRRPGPEDDILRGVAEALKAAGPDALTDRGKALAMGRLRQTAGHASKGLAAPLGMSKGSCECPGVRLLPGLASMPGRARG